jgi:hypothetical protein
MKFDFGTEKAHISAARERLDALETSQLNEGCRLLFEKLMVPDLVKKLLRFKRASLVTTLSQLNPCHALTACSFDHLKPEEDKDKRKWRWGQWRTNFPVLKAPRQRPLVLLIEVHLTEGKALGNEEGKVLRCGVCYDQRKKLEQGFTTHDRNSDITVGRAALE